MQNETNLSETRVPSLVQDPRQLPTRFTSPTATRYNDTPHNPAAASNAPLPQTPPLTQKQQSASSEPMYYTIKTTSRQHLKEIVADGNILPLRVVFCDSIYGFHKNFTFYSDEPFDIHFMKTFLVANVYTNTNKYFEIPLQAPFQFTLNYPQPISLRNTNHNVSKLLKLDVLPSLAIVKTECKGNCKSSPFVKDEILVIQSRIKSSTIECVSLSLNGEKKRIHKSSEAVFTINPSRLKIDFTDLKYFNFPLQVHIYTTAQDNLQSEFTLLSTIAGLVAKKSLIASFSDRCDEHFELYDIFIDTPIDFQQAKCSQADKDKLLEKSKEVFQNFNPVDIKKVIPAEATDNFIQAHLYNFSAHADKKGKWKQVTKLCQPDSFTRETTWSDTSGTSQESHCNAIPRTSVPTAMSLDSLSRLQQSQPSVPAAKLLSSGKQADSFQMPTKHATKEKHIKSALKLEELSCEQVLHILDQLNLQQYKESFAKEKITGSLLKELNEEILIELGVTSKLHRIKLMRVIQVKESLNLFFNFSFLSCQNESDGQVKFTDADRYCLPYKGEITTVSQQNKEMWNNHFNKESKLENLPENQPITTDPLSPHYLGKLAESLQDLDDSTVTELARSLNLKDSEVLKIYQGWRRIMVMILEYEEKAGFDKPETFLHLQRKLDQLQHSDISFKDKRIIRKLVSQLDSKKSVLKETELDGFCSHETKKIDGKQQDDFEAESEECVPMRQQYKDQSVQFNYMTTVNDCLDNVHVGGEAVYLIQGRSVQSFNWSEWGLKIHFPEDSLAPPPVGVVSSDPASTPPLCSEVAVKALVGGEFQLPPGSELVSAVYAISLANKLRKPVQLEIQHCAVLKSENQLKRLTFVKAPMRQCVPPFEFNPLEGGEFSIDNQWGSIALDHFCLIAIILVVKNIPVGVVWTSSRIQETTVNVSTSDKEGISSNSDIEAVSSINTTAEDHVISDIDVQTDSDSNVQSPSNDVDLLYSGLLSYSRLDNRVNQWLVKFMAMKDIVALETYLEKKCPTEIVDQPIEFGFRGDNGLLELLIDQESSYNGWRLYPHKHPLKIRQEQMNKFGRETGVPFPPSCLITINVSDPNTAQDLHYSVPIGGVVCDTEMIFINRLLEQEFSSSQSHVPPQGAITATTPVSSEVIPPYRSDVNHAEVFQRHYNSLVEALKSCSSISDIISDLAAAKLVTRTTVESVQCAVSRGSSELDQSLRKLLNEIKAFLVVSNFNQQKKVMTKFYSILKKQENLALTCVVSNILEELCERIV